MKNKKETIADINVVLLKINALGRNSDSLDQKKKIDRLFEKISEFRDWCDSLPEEKVSLEQILISKTIKLLETDSSKCRERHELRHDIDLIKGTIDALRK